MYKHLTFLGKVFHTELVATSSAQRLGELS